MDSERPPNLRTRRPDQRGHRRHRRAAVPPRRSASTRWPSWSSTCSPRRVSSRRTSSRSCAAAPARARSPRRSSTRGSRRPRASPARSPSATRSRSSTSRSTGVAKDAAEQIPLHVLERVVAIPYALEDSTLRVAVADPGNLHGLDELRLATRHPLDLGVASSEDILVELRRMARASEAFGARAVLEEVDDEPRRSARRTRPTISRPTTGSPTRRSSGSSTPSSSRLPRTAPPTSTSSRRRTRSSSASASTACSRRCSGSRSG